MPNLRIDAIAGLWEALGLTCTSSMSTFPDSAALFGNLYCEGTDQATNVDVVAEAVYWTPDGIQLAHVGFTTIREQELDYAASADRWILPFAHLAGGDAVTKWVRDHVGSASCHLGCDALVAGDQLEYEFGRLGAQELFIEAK
jgi:hypothetical protein